MGKEQELRPCPLCQAALTVEHFGAYGGPDGDWLTHPAGEHAACPIAALTFLATPEKIATWNRRSSSDEQVVGWPIDTEDQVEVLAKVCGWNNRRYMTPKDYAIWCDQMRQFAKLASPAVAAGGVTEKMVTRACEEAGLAVDPAAWGSDPVEADRIVSAYRSGMASILTTALAVRDEGMREGEK